MKADLMGGIFELHQFPKRGTSLLYWLPNALLAPHIWYNTFLSRNTKIVRSFNYFFCIS